MLAASELAAIRRNDVPYFETIPTSRDLLGCDGKRYADILPRSGLETASDILRGLGTADLHRQTELIRVALTTAGTVDSDTTPLRAPAIRTKGAMSAGQAAERIVRLAAREICNTAIVAEDSAAWFTIHEGAHGSLVAAPAALDLCSGLPGMALFLGCAAEALQDRDAHDVGRAATASVLAAVKRGVHKALPIGGHAGLGELAFALKELETIHRDLPVGEALDTVLKSIEGVELGAAPLELMTGVAGAVLGLAPNTGAIDLVAKLLRAACDRVEGASSTAHHDPVFDQPGMAHGIAGLNHALVVGAQLLPKGGLRDRVTAAAESLSLEADRSALPREMTWCGGVAGQLIGKISDECRTEAADTLRSALESDAFADDSLCHGTFGALVALGDCGVVQDAARRLLVQVAERGPRCGTIGAVSSPALLDGLAGIGLAALHFGCGAATPCVLAFQSRHGGRRSMQHRVRILEGA